MKKENFQKTKNSNIETKTNVRGWAENNAIIKQPTFDSSFLPLHPYWNSWLLQERWFHF